MTKEHKDEIVITGMAAVMGDGPIQRLTEIPPFIPDHSSLSGKLKRYAPQSVLWAAEAGERAMSQAQIVPGEPSFRWGVYTGQNGYQHPDFMDLAHPLSHNDLNEDEILPLLWNSSKLNPFLVTHSLSNNLLGTLSIHWRLKGDCAAFIRDETAAYASLEEAMFSLATHVCDVALVVNGGTHSDWISRDFSSTACKTITAYDSYQSGACALVLERRDHALRRLVPAYATVMFVSGRYLPPEERLDWLFDSIPPGDIDMCVYEVDPAAERSRFILDQVRERRNIKHEIDLSREHPRKGCEGLAFNIFVAGQLRQIEFRNTPNRRGWKSLLLTHGKSGFTSAAFIEGWPIL